MRLIVALLVFVQAGVRDRIVLGDTSGSNMGKLPVRLKEVVYTLSPFEQVPENHLWPLVATVFIVSAVSAQHISFCSPFSRLC